MTTKKAKTAQYDTIIVHIFQKHWKKGVEEFEFHRDEMVEAAAATAVERPDNLGDVIYSFKFRKTLPVAILGTAPRERVGFFRERAAAGIVSGWLSWVEPPSSQGKTSRRSRYLTQRRKSSAPTPLGTNRRSWQKCATTGS